MPDDTVLEPAQGFTKVWRLENTGATTWGEGYQFVLVGGQTLGAPHMLPVPPCRPGETADLTVSFVTPPEAGQYISAWSLADPQGNLFGEQVWTRITGGAGARGCAGRMPAQHRALRRGAVPQAAVEAPALPGRRGGSRRVAVGGGGAGHHLPDLLAARVGGGGRAGPAAGHAGRGG